MMKFIPRRSKVLEEFLLRVTSHNLIPPLLAKFKVYLHKNQQFSCFHTCVVFFLNKMFLKNIFFTNRTLLISQVDVQ